MNKVNKLLCIILVLSLSCSSINAKNIDKTYDKASNFISDYSKSVVGTPLNLYNLDNQLTAIYYSLNNGGYIVIDINSLQVLEYSLEKNIAKIENTSEKRIYYLGALSYWKKENDSMINILSENIVENLSELQAMLKSYQEKKNRLILKDLEIAGSREYMSITGYDYEDRISGLVPNYSYNPNGICGSTAAAMYFRYYDLYKNDNYVDTGLESYSGRSLIKYLVSYIDGTEPGSTSGELYGGMISYLDDRNIDQDLTLENSYDGVYASSAVSQNKPYVLGLISPAHWVTGYGYAIKDGTYFAIVNNGHGDRNIYINFLETDFIVY